MTLPMKTWMTDESFEQHRMFNLLIKGDTVIIYMPMIPEAAVSMLACARIGAVHSVVFGGFAASELAIRIDHAQPKVLVTASGAVEGKKFIAYKPLLDKAIEQSDHQPNMKPAMVVMLTKMGMSLL